MIMYLTKGFYPATIYQLYVDAIKFDGEAIILISIDTPYYNVIKPHYNPLTPE